MCRIEQPLRLQAALQLLILQRDLPGAGLQHALHIDLHAAVALIQRDISDEQDAHAVGGDEFQRGAVSAEEDGANRRRSILERKIDMPRGM